MPQDDDAPRDDDPAPSPDPMLERTPREEMDAAEDAEQGLVGRQRRRLVKKFKTGRER